MASSEAHEPSRSGVGRRRAARLAWSCVALSFLLAVSGQLISLSVGADFGHSEVYDLAWFVIITTLAIVGALVAARQPHNPIGWIMVALTVFAGFVSLAATSTATLPRRADRKR